MTDSAEVLSEELYEWLIEVIGEDQARMGIVNTDDAVTRMVAKLRNAGYSIVREYEPSVEGLLYDEAVSLSYWLAKQLSEDADRQSDLGETLTDTVKRLLAANIEREQARDSALARVYKLLEEYESSGPKYHVHSALVARSLREALEPKPEKL